MWIFTLKWTSGRSKKKGVYGCPLQIRVCPTFTGLCSVWISWFLFRQKDWIGPEISFFATLIKSGGDFLLCLRSSAFQSSFHQGCRSLAPLCSKLQRAKATSRELLRWKTCCVDCCKSSSDISSRRHASKTSSVSLSKLKVQKLSLLYYRVT